MQRIINLNKNMADLLSDKITRLEHKHDLLIDEVVNDHLVKHTRDLVSRMDILYRRLDESFISHDVDIERAKDTIASVKRDVGKLRDELKDIETVLSSHKKDTKDNK
jgi:hypothetical protein